MFEEFKVFFEHNDDDENIGAKDYIMDEDDIMDGDAATGDELFAEFADIAGTGDITGVGDMESDDMQIEILDFDDSQELFPMAGSAAAYETFRPEQTDPDCVIGNPEEVLDKWHMQASDSTCAVVSQEFVAEQLLGREFHEADLVRIAEEHGWYTSEGGTLADDVGNILEYMGLQVERSCGNSLEDLEKCLASGREVIVGVDADELWNGKNEEWFWPGRDANHAVQVIGIDKTDPEEPMIILNDPGASNGRGAMVPADEFLDAWEDSGCFMVEAYV